MGGSYSASSSATSGNKSGPVTFGGISFGDQGSNSKSTIYLAIVGVIGVVAWLVFRKN